jgi:hypothetical protein
MSAVDAAVVVAQIHHFPEAVPTQRQHAIALTLRASFAIAFSNFSCHLKLLDGYKWDTTFSDRAIARNRTPLRGIQER